MPRIEPAELEGNAVQKSLLASVLGSRPEILKSSAGIDAATRFHALLPQSLKQAVRSATAGAAGCEYCQSLGTYTPNPAEQKESLAVALALMVAGDPTGIGESEFNVLRGEFTDEEIVELVAFTCFVATAGQPFGATMGLEAASDREAAAYQKAASRA